VTTAFSPVADPAEDTEIPETLLRHVETLNRLIREQGSYATREYLEAQGDEVRPYPYMAAPLIDEGEEVTRCRYSEAVVKEEEG
jgi:hypothetical protein